MKRINWLYLVIGYLGLFVYGLIDNVRGPLFPDLLAQFNLDDKTGSSFFYVASLTALASTLTASYWLSRATPVVLFRRFTFVQIAALLIIAFSNRFAFTLIGSAVLGASFGALGLLVNTLVAEAAPAEIRRRAMAGLHTMYGISSLLAPLFVNVVYNFGGIWRTALLVLLVGSGAVLIATFNQFKSSRENQTLGSEEGRENEKSPVPRRLRNPRTIAFFLAILVSGYVAAEVLLGTRIALYARRELGYAPENANFLVSGFFFGLFIGRLLLTLIPIPIKTRSILWLSALASLTCFALGLTVHPLFLALTGFAMAAFYPSAMALVVDELGVDANMGLTWTQVAQAIALLSMHVIVGVLSDAFGLRFALWFGPACLVVTLIFLFTTRKTEKYLV